MLWSVILRRVLRTIVFASFGWVLIFTNYGLIDYIKLRKDFGVLQKEHEKLVKQKEELLRYVQALSGPDIDLDLLEIQVRKILVYASKDEDIYFWK